MIPYPDDQRVVESMARIRHDNDFIRIIAWLEEVKLGLATGAMIMSEEKFGRNQGGYLTLDEFLEYVRQAPGVIEAAHVKQRKPKTHIP
jgi:hypothetical protein